MNSKKHIITKIVFAILCLISLSANAQLAGLVITGTPDSPSGATWTYNATIGTVVYDLKGLLYKPVGSGSFPAVIINHGTGGNTDIGGYSDKVAKEMVTWGYVTIATNYCHMGTSVGFPCGSPGVCSGMTDWGASSNNFLRGMKVWDILASLSYVDTNCIATFGHSRGSFLTTGLAADYPDKFNCAGHTDGGFGIPDQPTMPTFVMANDVSIPYIMHHGELTTQVPIINDNNLDSILTLNSVPHSYYIYIGYYHVDMPYDTLVYSRTKTFFNQYICGSTTSINDSQSKDLRKIDVFPNPTNGIVNVNIGNEMLKNIKLYNASGEFIQEHFTTQFSIANIPIGLYFAVIQTEKGVSVSKVIKQK